MIQGIRKKVKNLQLTWRVDAATEAFIRFAQSRWKPRRNAKKEILVDLFFARETLISYAYFANLLAEEFDARICSFAKAPRFLYRWVDRVYSAFGCEKHIRISLSAAQKTRAAGLVEEHSARIKTKEDLLALRVDEIEIGIDIYESYLRELNRPTVEIGGKEYFKYLRKGIETLVFWLDYFASHQVAAVIVSHDVFIQTNIIAKVAYKSSIPVYLPNTRGAVYATEPFSVYANFGKYKEYFSSLTKEQQEEGIRWAEGRLKMKFEGTIGVDMTYSTQTGYHKKFTQDRLLNPTDKFKVLICSHCFFDNPHAYGRVLFPDFYEWISFLGKTAEETDYEWYLKIHPDPLPGTLDIVTELSRKYPKIQLLPHDASHHQLVAEGINCVLTVYGSVGHEYPALGVPVINAGYNPRIGYNFNLHPKNIADYKTMILSINTNPPEISVDELKEFYFVHFNLRNQADDLFFPSQTKFFALSLKEAPSFPFRHFLENLDEKKEARINQRLLDFIRSGKRHLFGHGPCD